MSANLDKVRSRVQQILTENFGNVQIDSDGDYSLQHGSARAFVRVLSVEDRDESFVRVEVPLVFGVRPSPDLFKHIATNGGDYIFGHLNVSEQDDGNAVILFSHTLLGDYLDEAELGHAVGAMLGSSDRIDDELRAMFGGTRFHEE